MSVTRGFKVKTIIEIALYFNVPFVICPCNEILVICDMKYCFTWEKLGLRIN